MKDLYQAKEAALIVDQFANYIEDLARDHEDYGGSLGSTFCITLTNPKSLAARVSDRVLPN